ncbi:MAG: hypothetical protein AB7I12_00255 [Steroidobacteraceae bacterium]
MNQSFDDKPEDSALAKRSRELFNEQVANLDARTRSRLNQARQTALDAVRGESHAFGVRWLVPAGGVAALVLAGLFSVQFIGSGDEPLPDASMTVASTVADVEIIASGDELEMLQNVDFYAWLETQSDTLNSEGNPSEAG